MSRRRTDEEMIADLIIKKLYSVAKSLPWYVDIIIAAVSYFAFHHLFVSYSREGVTAIETLFRIIALILQYLLPIIFGIGTVVSFSVAVRNKELFRSTSEGNVMDRVSKMGWQDFERLIGEYFKSKGYSVTQEGGAHADGGVDVEVRKGGELYLVQCKHYRSWKVPVETVRDLYGAMTARGAAGGFVVTSGRFTKPAKEFAEGRSITLIDGKELSSILQQHSVDTTTSTQPTANVSAPNCPNCGNVMVRRTAHKGSHAGQEFWGCSQYPACKGVRPITQ